MCIYIYIERDTHRAERERERAYIHIHIDQCFIICLIMLGSRKHEMHITYLPHHHDILAIIFAPQRVS